MNKEFFSRLKVLLSFRDILSRRDLPWESRVVFNFEKKLSEYLGVPHVLGVASGTDALILALKACGIGPGDEVLVPALSFFSTASAVAWIGAKPVFVDVDSRTLNIDPFGIERVATSRAKAIILVHLNGLMADVEHIMKIAQKKSLPVIEDATHAFGSKYKDKHIGYYGTIACLSFNPTKILGGPGDGGAVITTDSLLAEKVNFLRRYGSRYSELGVDHPIVGVASRLSSFQASVLNQEIEGIDAVIEKTRRNYFLYSRFLAGVDGLVLPAPIPAEYFINGYRFPVLTKQRDGLRKFLKERGIEARFQYGIPLPYFTAFNYLGYKRGDFPVSEKIAEEVLCLPTECGFSEKEIAAIANLIKGYFSNSRG